MVISYRFGLFHKPFSFQYGLHTVDSRSERLTTDNYSNGE